MQNTIRDPLTQRSHLIGSILAGLVYVFLLAPIFVTIPMAFGPTNALSFPPSSYSLDLFRSFFASDSWLTSLYNSLKVGMLSTCLAIFAGVPAAYWIARHNFIGKIAFSSVLMSPLVIPSIVSGLGVYLYFSYIRINGTLLALVLGHVMVTLPYVIVMIIAGVQKIDRNLEFGAELMGAKPLWMFVTVVLPQLIPSLVSAAFFAFLLSFDEVVIAWFLTGTDTMTLPVKMYSALEWEVSPVIAAVSTLMTGVSIIVCAVAVYFNKLTPGDS